MARADPLVLEAVERGNPVIFFDIQIGSKFPLMLIVLLL